VLEAVDGDGGRSGKDRGVEREASVVMMIVSMKVICQ
jgi:hypothetical protein